jgi:hypothetical protein
MDDLLAFKYHSIKIKHMCNVVFFFKYTKQYMYTSTTYAVNINSFELLMNDI